MLLVAGCASGGDNVEYIVITNTPSSGVVQVNSQSVAQAPTTAVRPTEAASMTPEVALRIGDRYLLYGYYESAVSTYQSILARENVPQEISAAAAFNMGRAALQAGLFREAVEAMNYLINNFPEDFRAAQAYFLRGDAYLGLSQWQNAINDFERYLILRPGLVDSYTYERIADAQVNLGQLDAAFESYAQATSGTRPLVAQLALKEKVANLYTLNGQVEAAVAQYDSILEVAQNAPYRASIEYAAAQALLSADDVINAQLRLRRIFSDYPDRPEAYLAMQELLEAGLSLDAYQQGIVSYYAGEYEEAVEAFNRYTSTTSLAAIPAELQLFLGRAYRALGNSEAAQGAFRTLMEQYPNDPLFGEAALETGRTLFLNGEIDTAIERYLEIANTYSYLSETAAEALWRAGYLHATNERPAESLEVFTQLADTYPQTEQARSGLFIAASAALSADDTLSAETLYARLAETTTGEDQAAAFLQVGLLALERGDTNAATAAFTSASNASPDTYYSARAEDLLAGRPPFSSPPELAHEFDDLAEVTEAENWLRSRLDVQQEGPLWPLAPHLRDDPRLLRGRELWAVGVFDAASDEFLDIIEAYQNDALASYQLAVEMRLLGAFRPSIVAAANTLNAMGVDTLEAPAYIARMRYPIYYWESVLEQAEARGMDPLVIFSMIRHESLFDTYARGAAEEKGLTQVIPPTGEYIADQLDWPDYQHQDLFRPYAAIAFGSYYLDEQLERFDQNTYAALSGYNAGPGRAADWLALSGGDPDRFMSTITIDSVQLYIRSIYRNYSIYRELYSAT